MTGKKGQSKPRASNKSAPAHKGDKHDSDEDVPPAIQKDKGTKSTVSLEEIEKRFEDRLVQLETSHQAKLDALYRVLEQKDEIIGRLHIEIGEMKQSLNYLHSETSEIRKNVSENAKKVDAKFNTTATNVNEIKLKTVDLEDRSRRCNLVFYNFPEAPQGATEDCEKLVVNLLGSLKILEEEETIWIERAHRLGRKKPENEKPRPIIVCFSYFKQKQEVVKNGHKFKNVTIKFSEDYSRETLQEHKKLFAHGKEAKEKYVDENKEIRHFKITYKRLVITYGTNKQNANATTFVKSYTLRDIAQNPNNWFIPPIVHRRETNVAQRYTTSVNSTSQQANV